ncbi:SGNH/GDSL hydrolase family protein [Anatilimnocola floriformis]|uniref:SGNH/GDSL hydrolase family protein n=1 Tax=Anatilimnocola floriformis TaxID=2948575 RepID=UPI0020C27523|nr:SGNH/GDSL hydrolase family protein [Anatilimnocola floriformis]
MRLRSLLLVLCLSAAASAQEKLPKVVLIGDSIRMSYAPIVAKQLEGKAVIVESKSNGGDSANLVAKLKELAISEQPDIVHFNCGIHDTKKDKEKGTFQTPPEKYEANLRKIVETIRKETKAKVIFATTTPIVDDRAAKQREKATYELLDASTVQYNEIARRVMKELEVPVDDVRAAVEKDAAKLITADGVHFTDEGRKKLGLAVAEFLEKQLAAKK